MDKFIRLADAVTEFEADYNDTAQTDHTKYTLAIQQEELKTLWKKAKAAYEELVNSDTLDAKAVSAVKPKYKSSYAVYLRCMSNMADLHAKLVKSEKDIEGTSVQEHNIHLPPCDTEVFKGDYLSWPTFRDMFTAIYILNKRLTPVEKLFHLNQKTLGEAKDIVRKCPLTNEGFATAWKNLTDRYENKRILVNSQLQILFNLKAIENECGVSIKKLQRDINNCISSLKSHKIDISNWDAIFTYLCSTKLPESTLALWEQTIEDKTEISKWEDMDKFLSNRFQTLETVSGITGTKLTKIPKPHNSRHTSETPQKRLGAFQASVAKTTCKFCKSKDHKLSKCERFINLTTADRIAFIKSNHGCLNCLSNGHTVSRCTCSFNCSTCHQRHHTLLHIQAVQPKATMHQRQQTYASKDSDNIASTSAQAQAMRDAASAKKNSVNKVTSCFANTNKGVLLGTARVHIFYNNTNFSARALIDSGSECSFITERLKRRINLPSKRMHAQVSGINNTISAQVKEACLIQLRSPIDPLININTTVLVLPQLTGNLPTCQINAMTSQAFPDLELADKRFFINEQVDLVLGGDIYAQIMLSGIRKNILGTLLAQETVFGWILTGQTDTVTPANKCVSFFNEVSLDKRLASFWEVEDIPKNQSYNKDEVYCEELYKSTTKRNGEGKYIVSLPFKQDFPKDVKLGPSLKIACSQFFRIEKRLARDPPLQTEYNRVLSEYEALGHMTRIDVNVPADACDNYFLPHHAVRKDESTTTKVRVVFNASCPTSNGVSLNEVLYPGPVLQNDLPTLILRWRLFKYVFNSDIEKMYRQILLNPDQTKYQRIIFRTNPSEPIRLYELNTVTFGVNCAPYLAIRTLLRLANDVEDSHPIASDILRKYMYVDDVLAGGHTIESAIKAKDEITTVLQSAATTGFSVMSAQDARNEIIRENIPKLIKELTGLADDDENLRSCEQMAWSIIRNHRNLSTNSHEVRRKIEGIQEKFAVDNNLEYAEHLGRLCDEIIQHPLCVEHYEVDVHWSMLLNLAYILRLERNSCVKYIESNSNPLAIVDLNESTDDADYVTNSQIAAIELTYIRCHQYLANKLNNELLQIAASNADSDCDRHVEQFLNGKIDVQTFLNNYTHSKKVSAERKAKEERLGHQLSALERAGI
ncbi:uncharacterized protein LOC118746379 [Rhagoletis pomonella]|uniref:uncharacterized protein LOC118746379 n=1 Tax=Rhagoletis pomonella TaxID=28610 RepID=UPI00177AE084|nr:uncharacterized protein LOC118746379 [Rhagoletis pomonella]